MKDLRYYITFTLIVGMTAALAFGLAHLAAGEALSGADALGAFGTGVLLSVELAAVHVLDQRIGHNVPPD